LGEVRFRPRRKHEPVELISEDHPAVRQFPRCFKPAPERLERARGEGFLAAGTATIAKPKLATKFGDERWRILPSGKLCRVGYRQSATSVRLASGAEEAIMAAFARTSLDGREASAVLLGNADPASGMIDAALAVDVTSGAKRTCDSINPGANVVAEVVEEAAERGFELTGLAHSHPSGCVYPSPTDLDSGSTIRRKFRLARWVVLIGVPDGARWQLVPWVVRPGGRTDWCERSTLRCAALL
jgi:hypothetical protein